ncbi:MAG TPA: carbon storage regulator CsrA [Candidatus Eremiobacteraceae bacterium]|nr:carbon storage regulator CsrA [Candidatus Eremiobacteraceae bacterium]
MLVLTRKLNQEIVIGDDIRITIVAVGGDQVKLGITAPRSVPVHRMEVYQERRAEAPLIEKTPVHVG